MVVAALAGAAAVLLVVAGAAKLRTPGPAAVMLVGLWPALRPLRRARRVARLAGTVELATGLAVLAGGGRAALTLLAGCYLVLAAVAVRLLTRDERVPCGCFGAADGAVGAGHVAVDLAAFAVAVWGVARAPSGLATLFDAGPLTGITATGQAVLLAALGYLVITALPALTAARRALEEIK
jgi:hypothetical protein